MPADDLRLTDVPTVATQMGIRRRPPEVFAAFVDPSVISKFWIEGSTGQLEDGATLRWTMNAEGATAEVRVMAVEPSGRIAFDWGADGQYTHVEMRFEAWGDEGTLVKITETGLSGSGDEMVARAADSTGGFTMVLCSLKALLEHGTELRAVSDRAPDGF